jgi:hypothetical protein
MITGNSSTPHTPILRRVVAASTLSLGSDVRWQRAGFGTDIRRLMSRTRLINLRFKISRFRNQHGSKLTVCGFLGKLEKRRYLINEIIPA